MKRPRLYEPDNDYYLSENSPSLEEVLACLNNGEDLVEKVQTLKSMLDSRRGRIKSNHRYKSKTSIYPLHSASNILFYESILLESDFLSVLNVDVYWMLSLAGIISFEQYLSKIDIQRVSHFLREDVVQLRISENIQNQDPLSSIFFDVITYLFASAYFNNEYDTSLSVVRFRGRSLDILESILFPQESEYSAISALDMYTLEYCMDAIEIGASSTAHVKKCKVDCLRKFLARSVEFQCGLNDTLSERHSHFLQRYEAVEIASTLRAVLLSKERHNILHVDSNDRESNATRPAVLVALDHLLDIDQTMYFSYFIDIAVEIAVHSCGEGDAAGIVRAVRIMEVLYPRLLLRRHPHPQTMYCDFLEAVFNVEKPPPVAAAAPGLQSRPLHCLSATSFRFLCLSLLETVPLQSDDTLKLVCKAIALHKQLCSEAAETYLKAARVKLQVLSRYLAFFGGQSSSKAGFDLDLARLQSWIATVQRTGFLPVGISQQCLIAGQQGYRYILAALSTLMRESPSVRRGCVDIVRRMGAGERPLCPSEEAQEFISSAESGIYGEDGIDAVMQQLHTPGQCTEHMRRYLRLVTSVCESIAKRVKFESADLARTVAQEIFDASQSMLLLAVVDGDCSVGAALCTVFLHMYAAFAHFAFSRDVCAEELGLVGEWTVWLESLWCRVIKGNDLMEAACTAVILDHLDTDISPPPPPPPSQGIGGATGDRQHRDDILVLGALFRLCDDQFLLRIFDTAVRHAGRYTLLQRLSRTQWALYRALELHRLCGKSIAGSSMLLHLPVNLVFCYFVTSFVVASCFPHRESLSYFNILVTSQKNSVITLDVVSRCFQQYGKSLIDLSTRVAYILDKLRVCNLDEIVRVMWTWLLCMSASHGTDRREDANNTLVCASRGGGSGSGEKERDDDAVADLAVIYDEMKRHFLRTQQAIAAIEGYHSKQTSCVSGAADLPQSLDTELWERQYILCVTKSVVLKLNTVNLTRGIYVWVNRASIEILKSYRRLEVTKVLFVLVEQLVSSLPSSDNSSELVRRVAFIRYLRRDLVAEDGASFSRLIPYTSYTSVESCYLFNLLTMETTFEFVQHNYVSLFEKKTTSETTGIPRTDMLQCCFAILCLSKAYHESREINIHSILSETFPEEFSAKKYCLNERLLGWCFLSSLSCVDIPADDCTLFMEFILTSLKPSLSSSSDHMGDYVSDGGTVIVGGYGGGGTCFLHCVLSYCVLLTLELAVTLKHDRYLSHILTHAVSAAGRFSSNKLDTISTVAVEIQRSTSSAIANIGVKKVLLPAFRIKEQDHACRELALLLGSTAYDETDEHISSFTDLFCSAFPTI